MSFVRKIYCAIFILLIQVQRKSYSQYYPSPPNPRYYDDSPDPDYFNRRDLEEPPVRQHQHYYHVYQEPVAYEYRVATPPGPIEKFYTTSRPKIDSASDGGGGGGRVRLSFYDDRMEIIPDSGEDTEDNSSSSMERDIVVVILRPRRCPQGDQRVFRGDGKCYKIYSSTNSPCPSFMTFIPERDNPTFGDCGCPDDHDQIVFRKHRNDGKCYPILSKGRSSPCGRYMKFYPSGNGIHGECDCDIDNGIVSRPLAYWKPHDRCYLLFHRGPCYQNQWLILNKEGHPQCSPRPRKCVSDDSEISSRFPFLHNGKCYETGRHYPDICGSDKRTFKVYFPAGEHTPKCFEEEPKTNDKTRKTLLSPATDLRCKPGYKKMQNGECKRKAKFDRDYYY